MRDRSTQLKALEGVGVFDRGISGGKVRGEAVLVTCEGAIVHVPEEGGAASAVFGGTADEEDGAVEAGTDPMLAVVDTTPNVVGVVADGGSDAEVIVHGSRSDWVFVRSGSGWSGHNGSGGQCQEPQRFQQCVQFHSLMVGIRLVGLRSDTRMGWIKT